MNCYIKEIIIFKENGEKRNVELSQGLNIITGNSKTGKSALIEIVDYCLCSKLSQIPQGEISKFGFLFCIILKFPTKSLIIARKSYWDGGSNQMLVKVENDDLILSNLSLNYFSDLKFSSIKNNVQLQIEAHIGLNISNMAENNDIENKKASLRDMTSFFFQHQNLIANKHALFYRFDDFAKRASVILSFPVFAGIVDDNYYYLNRQLDEKKNELKQLIANSKKQEKTNADNEKELKGYFRNYYSIIGKSFNESLSMDALLKLRDNLPDYTSKTFITEDVQNRYDELTSESKLKISQLDRLKKNYRDIENSEKYANQYVDELDTLDKKTPELNINNDYNCPVCGQEHKSLNTDIEKTALAKIRLKNEILRASTYRVSYVKEKEEIEKEKYKLVKEIRIINREIEEIEKTVKAIRSNKSVSERSIYAKARIDMQIEEFEKSKGIKTENDDSEVKAVIALLEQQLSKYQKENLFKKAETMIAENMNKIGNKLDFETELKPIDFWFNLEDFSFTHNLKNTGTIRLGEMGSGANWLACHLSLFLSFLHLFSINKKSKVPSILFLDQPSQIYFPKEFDPKTDEDIKQVSVLYKTILDEIAEIKDKAGYEPQIIVTDHADNLDLSPFKFEDYVKARWTDGKALI